MTYFHPISDLGAASFEEKGIFIEHCVCIGQRDAKILTAEEITDVVGGISCTRVLVCVLPDDPQSAEPVFRSRVPKGLHQQH